MRYFVELAYKGTRFHGWQVQDNACTLQAELNRALAVVLRHSVETCGCGRTDSGVHARQFFAQFDSPDPIPDTAALACKLNRILLPDLCIYRIFEVAANASVRFDAVLRTYKYFISIAKNPFWQEFSWHCPCPLDVRRMNAAARLLLQATEFGSFAKSHSSNKTNTCRIACARFAEDKRRRMIVFTIAANRFLRNMVRAIVGTLVDVGNGRMPPRGMLNVIESQKRSAAGVSVPARGLFLWEVQYPYINQQAYDFDPFH